MELGARIKAWLGIRGMSQKALAEAVGVTPAAVTAWVKVGDEATSPTQKNLESIVKALGMTMAEFYGGMPESRSSAA